MGGPCAWRRFYRYEPYREVQPSRDARCITRHPNMASRDAELTQADQIRVYTVSCF
ncbi:unnamed protein product [Fusarium graminearum]|uniref:Chromosome 4, complete genome n=1 Tax=Gibberella zeae (strain ATCC MYA-4620 / CBS 123657 / FGSC 9075 / NRRL 31084 / PH-1) TaxID=229533 RepID=I1S9S0_GIBZE|nr:hypothetical protein FGSG_13601 [Fusarium graminearum PH-1]ESU16120.1 hypothetical protein FGSG_13601 [Fusarium graminearum PH-1]CEF82827.1 unnamed protein product [Fusarium graminearum]CZS74356.1 unnamed protein product [Fusarium graminearum]|eukprot:XP_011328196.1 hypothetical protein FGSG_13601 [Fusarium graminearum PH-1]